MAQAKSCGRDFSRDRPLQGSLPVEHQALPAIAAKAGLKAHLWVASAGFGLVPADSALHSYSATLSPDSPYAVIPTSQPPHSATHRG